jgi:hypothetical protein
MGDRDASTRSPPGRAYRHGGTPASCMCSFNSKPGAARARAKRPLSCGRATLAAMDETPRPFRCARSMPRRLGREARRPMISGMRRAVRALRQLQPSACRSRRPQWRSGMVATDDYAEPIANLLRTIDTPLNRATLFCPRDGRSRKGERGREPLMMSQGSKRRFTSRSPPGYRSALR